MRCVGAERRRIRCRERPLNRPKKTAVIRVARFLLTEAGDIAVRGYAPV